MIVGAARIVAAETDFAPGHVAIEGDRITAVGAGIPAAADRVFPEATVIPGIIDLQVNGASGVDLLDCDAAAVSRLSDYLASTGVTAFLPTLVTAPAERISSALQAIRTAHPTGAVVLGIHLEGPVLNHQKKGAHHPRWLRAPGDPEVRAMYANALPDLRMVTLAPELPGTEALMDWLLRERIIVSVGHTEATYEQTAQAFAHGARMVTHLFNAMRPFHHRDPGVVGAAFDDPRCICGLIADGVHVHPAVVRLVYRMLGSERVALVSDAVAAAGMPPGTFTLGNRPIRVKAGDAPRVEDGTLAGSVLRMDLAISNLTSWGIALRDAVFSSSQVPARLLGATGRGALAPGLRADLVVLGRDGRAVFTLVGGRVAYERNP